MGCLLARWCSNEIKRKTYAVRVTIRNYGVNSNSLPPRGLTRIANCLTSTEIFGKSVCPTDFFLKLHDNRYRVAFSRGASIVFPPLSVGNACSQHGKTDFGR